MSMSQSTSSPTTPEQAAADASTELRAALHELRKVIVGQEELLERVIIALLSKGHLLIEGVPGLAKTKTVATLAETLGGSFARIQFTPDLVPSDLVGTRVYTPDGTFETEKGPVFANLLLADEINRAPAKVQSALLEVMQEHQVTIGKETFRVPEPFVALATMNPIENEGTYPLPEAQVDRFMMKVVVDYPNPREELEVVRRSLVKGDAVEQVLDIHELQHLQRLSTQVFVDQPVAEYAVAIVAATRQLEAVGLGKLAPYVEFGASPRATLALVHGARSLALLRGRHYALPSEVTALAPDVLRHRIVLTYRALAEQIGVESIISSVLRTVPQPRVDASRFRSKAEEQVVNVRVPVGNFAPGQMVSGYFVDRGQKETTHQHQTTPSQGSTSQPPPQAQPGPQSPVPGSSRKGMEGKGNRPAAHVPPPALTPGPEAFFPVPSQADAKGKIPAPQPLDRPQPLEPQPLPQAPRPEAGTAQSSSSLTPLPIPQTPVSPQTQRSEVGVPHTWLDDEVPGTSEQNMPMTSTPKPEHGSERAASEDSA